MAFWGIVIKAGKPFVLAPHKSCGRLRISQATLGTGSSNNKSLVQCNVGNKAPVILCTLLPGKAESCHLELEFEEVEEVTFSAIGPGKVYLTGYFVGNVRRNVAGEDESESYGEDLGESDTERSAHGSDYEKDSFIDDSLSESYGVDVGESDTDRSANDSDYEKDSFIDDSDLVVFSPSPSSLEIINEKMHGTKRGQKNCLKKKYELSVSDEDGAISTHNTANEQFGDPIENGSDDMVEISSCCRTQINSKRKRPDDSEKDDHSPEDCKVEKKNRKSNKDNEASRVEMNKADYFIEFAGEKNGRARTDLGGLVIEDLEDGDEVGKIASTGNKVTIHYTGKLKKLEKVFDSTVGKDPLKFRIGKNQVMDGLELGIEGMRVGSKRRLHIPPALGFGSEGTDRVPPDSWLIMDIELLRVHG